MLVYDITDEVSFKQVETWRQSFIDQASPSPEEAANFPFLLLGNKCDLESERAVQRTDGDKLAKKHNLFFFETSAKNNTNIDEAFRFVSAVAVERDTAPLSTKFFFKLYIFLCLVVFRIFSESLAEEIINMEEKTTEEAAAPGACGACTLI